MTQPHSDRLRWTVLALAAIVCVAVSGCERKPPPTGQPAGLTGRIRVSGAWALYPMMVKWQEEFTKLNPEVRIDVSAGGAGKGMSDALGGLVEIGMVSREVKPEESAQGAFYIPVVIDAVFPTINANNPALAKGLAERGMTRSQFVALWIEGKRLAWGEIAGADAGDEVQVYTRSDSCGAAETWAKYLDNRIQEDLKGVGVYGDPGVAEAVKRDRLGIGYNNLNFAYDPRTGKPVEGLRVIAIDVNENGKADAAESLATKADAVRAVASGAYPSPPARALYLVTKQEFRGASLEFVRWILSDGQKRLDEVGYIPLSEARLEEARKKVGSSASEPAGAPPY